MPEQIRTKWHKIKHLMQADEVYVSAPKDGDARPWSEYGPDKEIAIKLIDETSNAVPKFVIADDLLKITIDQDYQSSLLDMKRMDVLRLPYPTVVVEFNTSAGRAIVILRDNVQKPVIPMHEADRNILAKMPFYGIPLRIEADEEGEYLVMCPGVYSIDVEEKDGNPWLRFSASTGVIFRETPKVSKLLEDTFLKDASLLWRALCCAMLIMHTEGVSKEVVECTKINRKRIADKKTPVPRHTYLHIGKVYKSTTGDASEEYVPRKSPIPHWRRAHIRTVHFGKSRGQVKTVLILARIVANKSLDDTEPSMAKEYHVTR